MSARDLSSQQQRLLTGVLDEIIPRSEAAGLPGAGELGLVGHIEEALTQMPDLRPAVESGLAALAGLVGERGAEDLGGLAPSERQEILSELATAQPAFLPGLIFHTYVGYYQHPQVLEALGLEARPPFPKGYELESGDFGLLEAVRRRGPIYRNC